MRRLRTRPLFLLILLVTVDPNARPSRSLAADPDLGKDTAHYNAHRTADFLHMKVEMRFTPETILGRSCQGRVVHTLRARGESIETVRLDAVDMNILSVEMLGEDVPLEFGYDDRQLEIKLPRPLSNDQKLRIAIEYEIHDPPKGMHFILPSESAPDKATMVYTMSEALEARYWVPCHDWPNERWTTDIVVIVPKEYTVVSNGRLIKRLSDEATDLIAYHWQNDVPTDPHLMGFVFGQLVQLDGEWRGKPLRVFTQPGHEEAARYTFRRVDQMLDYFSELTGLEFPYPGYTHVTVVDHHHGGMEHAGYSLLRPMYLSVDEDGEMPSDLIEHNYTAHMLAHQWFGGIANYRSVSEAWLNEGFATYLDHLWYGRAYGEDRFDQLMRRDARLMAQFDSSESGQPMVNRHFANLDDVYTADGSKIYFKGAWVMHMLRHRLGRDLFWKAVSDYLNKHRWEGVETHDLRRVFEDASGFDLEQFFLHWVYGRGIPRLQIEYTWNVGDHHSTVVVRQSQKVDAEVPAFAFPLELLFRVNERDVRRKVWINEKEHDFTFKFDVPPSLFVVDPNNALLKTLTVTLPREMRLRQATSGPTIVSRLDAIEALGEDTSPKSVDVLREALDDKSQSGVVRAAAARSLGKMQREKALAALVASVRKDPENPEVSAAVMSALGQYPVSPVAHQILLERPAPGVGARAESAAILALGRMRARSELTEQSLTRLRAAVSQASRLQVRRAGLLAIRQLEDPRAYEAVLDIARPGQSDPLRGEAIRTLGVLGRDRSYRGQTRALLTRWLYDPDRPAQMATIDALGLLQDGRAIADLRRLVGSAHNAAIRGAAEEAIESIAAATPDSHEMVPELQHQIIALERRQQELEDTLLKLQSQLKQRKTGSPPSEDNPN